MKAKVNISLSKAIEEAIKFGFGNRFVLGSGMIHSIQTNEDFAESDFAVVKSYPVILNNGRRGRIQYIVLNTGELGFVVQNEAKTIARKKEISGANPYSIENINTYSI